MSENSTIVSPVQKPPKGMTSSQKRIAEKAITRRYAQLNRALVAAKGEITTGIVKLPSDWDLQRYIHRDGDSDDDVKATRFGPLRDEVVSLRKKVQEVQKKLKAARSRQEKSNIKAQKQIDEVARRMADSRDEAIIRVNFNGQSDDMLAFLAGLPTTESLLKSLKKLRLPVSIDEKKLLSCEE